MRAPWSWGARALGGRCQRGAVCRPPYEFNPRALPVLAGTLGGAPAGMSEEGSPCLGGSLPGCSSGALGEH